jgi:hypothetical protein
MLSSPLEYFPDIAITSHFYILTHFNYQVSMSSILLNFFRQTASKISCLKQVFLDLIKILIYTVKLHSPFFWINFCLQNLFFLWFLIRGFLLTVECWIEKIYFCLFYICCFPQSISFCRTRFLY